MEQYISKDALVAEIKERRDSLISLSESCPANTAAKSGFYAQAQTLEGILSFLDTLEVKEVNIADMADDYYDALMEEAAVWMDEGTMEHCRLAYYNGCKDVLNKIQKGE